MTPAECSEPKRTCPWDGNKFEEFGGMKRTLEDHGRQIGEIKRSVDDTNQVTRDFGRKLDAALVEVRKNGNGGARGNKAAVYGTLAGGGAAGGGVLYGIIEIIRVLFKAKTGG